MVHYLALPSHLLCNALYLHQNLYCIPEYNRPFWPQNSVHLQQNVCDVAPAHQISPVIHSFIKHQILQLVNTRVTCPGIY